MSLTKIFPESYIIVGNSSGRYAENATIATEFLNACTAVIVRSVEEEGTGRGNAGLMTHYMASEREKNIAKLEKLARENPKLKRGQRSAVILVSDELIVPGSVDSYIQSIERGIQRAIGEDTQINVERYAPIIGPEATTAWGKDRKMFCLEFNLNNGKWVYHGKDSKGGVI